METKVIGALPHAPTALLRYAYVISSQPGMERPFELDLVR